MPMAWIFLNQMMAFSLGDTILSPKLQVGQIRIANKLWIALVLLPLDLQGFV